MKHAQIALTKIGNALRAAEAIPRDERRHLDDALSATGELQRQLILHRLRIDKEKR